MKHKTWIPIIISIVLITGCSSIQKDQVPISKNNGFTIPNNSTVSIDIEVSQEDFQKDYYHEYTGTFSLSNSDSPQTLLNYISGVAFYEFEKTEEYNEYTRYNYRIVTKPEYPTDALDNHKFITKDLVEYNPETSNIIYDEGTKESIPEEIRVCPELPEGMNYVIGYHVSDIIMGFAACEDYFCVEIKAFNQKAINTEGEYFWIWGIAEDDTKPTFWKIPGVQNFEKPVVLYDKTTYEFWNAWEDDFPPIKPE